MSAFDMATQEVIDEQPSPSVSRRIGAAMLRSIPPLIVLLVIMGIWYYFSYGVLEPGRRFLLPPPHAVISEGFFDSEILAEIGGALLSTARVAFIGLLIAFVIGFSTALLMSQAKWIERSLYPWTVFLQTVPILAIVPLLGFWFGFGLSSRVIVCVIIALFPIIINTLTGLLGTDHGLLELATLHSAGRWARATKLQIPSALPDIFTGLRISAGLSVIGAVVGDFFFGRGSPGIGMLLVKYSRRLQSEELLSAVIVACGLGVVVFWVFGLIGRRVVGHWSEAWTEKQI